MEFIGRKEEISNLERLYSREESMNCAIYGRRRVGKTRLIQEFCRGKRALYLVSTSINRETVFRSYSTTISEFLGHEVEIKDETQLEECLKEAVVSDGKTVIAIDEFPFLVRACPDFPDILHRFIDTVMNDHPSMLIVSGSSMGAMKRILNDGQGPLFMRFPLQIHLKPLCYREARLFHPNMSEEDRVRAYAIAGGIPMYHLMLDGDLEETVSSVLLRPSGLLRTESESVLSLELKPWETYSKLLAIIGSRGRDLRGIVDSMGMSKSSCINLLDDLILLGVVSDENPYGMKRKTVYRISDGLMDFSFSVIQPYEGILSNDPVDPYDALRKPIETFYGRRFEAVCRQYIASTRRCSWIGRWWGTVPLMSGGEIQKDETGKVITTETDIDIVAVESENNAEFTVMCECKFTNRQMDSYDFETLLSDSGSVKGHGNRRYVMFSRAGFNPRLLRAVADSETRTELVDMDRLTQWAEGNRSRQRFRSFPRSHTGSAAGLRFHSLPFHRSCIVIRSIVRSCSVLCPKRSLYFHSLLFSS